MSVQALTWAARLPKAAAWGGARAVLAVLADAAHEDGTGAYPSVRTVAAYLGVSNRSVQRYLEQLETAGLIRRGDQRQAADIRADRRPVVWDLNLSLVRPGVSDLSPRALNGVTNLTPRSAHGVTESASRGDRTGIHGVTPSVVENRPDPRDNPPSHAPARTRTHARTREGDGGTTPWSDKPGARLVRDCLDAMPPRESQRVAPGYQQQAARVADELLSLGWLPGQVVREVAEPTWHNVVHSGAVLVKRLEELRALPAPSAPSSQESSKPPWCGQCEERTRQIETEDGRMTRCPQCHPMASGVRHDADELDPLTSAGGVLMGTPSRRGSVA